jgi:hypothetical protein
MGEYKELVEEILEKQTLEILSENEKLEEAEYKGKKVTLNKPSFTSWV